MSEITVTRFHDISVGHTVTGHESKCAHLHGHNYRIHFTILGEDLDQLGRVLDFGVIKSVLCEWLEQNWDHHFLIHYDDPRKRVLEEADPSGVVVTSFNPTAENMALYLLEEIGPQLLSGTNVRLISVRVEETYKCSVEARL